jgi:hypothetical protein
MSDHERLLEDVRPVSFAIAYRILGSVSEAEDMVQALLRVHQALEASEQVASPRPFVATVTSRLAINELRSARVRRCDTSANGCLGRSSPTAPLTPRNTRRWPTRCRWRCSCCSRASPQSSARSCCFTTSSTTTIRRSRRSSGKARTTCASSPPAPDATSSSPGPASKRRASSATSWHDGSFRPSKDPSALESAGLASRRREGRYKCHHLDTALLKVIASGGQSNL